MTYSIGHDTKYRKEHNAREQLEQQIRTTKRDIALAIIGGLMLVACSVVSAWWWLAAAK